jgi:hypothetical protein
VPFSPYVALRSSGARQALTVGPAASVRETLLLLDRMRADAVVVVDRGSRVPLGIITLHDVVRRIAIERLRPAGADATVMTSGLITVPADGTRTSGERGDGAAWRAPSGAHRSRRQLLQPGLADRSLHSLPGAQSRATSCGRSWRRAIRRWWPWQARSGLSLPAWLPSG